MNTFGGTTCDQALYSHGARKFWVHGTGALGCLPQKLAIPRDDDSDLDAHGCLKTYNAAARRFNTLLSEACNQLRQRMVDATIVFVDMFTIKYDLVTNHTKHGIIRFHHFFARLMSANHGKYFLTVSVKN